MTICRDTQRFSRYIIYPVGRRLNLKEVTFSQANTYHLVKLMCILYTFDHYSVNSRLGCV